MKRYLTSKLRGVFVGSGSDGMQEPEVCDAIIRLTRKAAPNVKVCYLGTATYDLPGPCENQTKQFVSRGCTLYKLAVGDPQAKVDIDDICRKIRDSDVIIVSGGNTLFACKRWEKLGLVPVIREAAERGSVMAGGSAGLIAWFDGGHSDSMDPETYRFAMVAPQLTTKKDESSTAPTNTSEVKRWKYIRVSGLGFLPGLSCPHYDRTQSNGVPRMNDFAEMRKRHIGESVICIDHWAALIVDEGKYSVLSLPNKPGSNAGRPWVYYAIASKDGGMNEPLPAPGNGDLSNILSNPIKIDLDDNECICGSENPT